MSRFRGHIERRIFQAVLLVLVDAVVVIPVDAAPTGPAGDARSLCASHKKQTRIDRKQARQGKPPMEGTPVNDGARWDAKNGVAVCTIVHERVRSNVVVLHQPHWCPQSGGSRPGPSPKEVRGEKILVERAWIRVDGTLEKSELEWTALGMVQERHTYCGRRFEGLALDDMECGEPGAQLAAMAELEAASVPAFDRLARELAAWDAPEDLVRRARLAKRDEIRHARVMTRLARRHGHAPRMFAVPPLPCRSLDAIAHENAIEGCVREAYGALVATYQGERARPDLRAAFRAIAVDERRHAELAEDVHAWILGRLDGAAGEAVEGARWRAESELRASVMTSQACAELGLPNGPDAVAMCDAYFG